MYHIQFQTAAGKLSMQEFDSPYRDRLVKHLAHFQRPFVNVYEGTSVITKAVRSDMQRMPASSLSRAAKDFIASRD